MCIMYVMINHKPKKNGLKLVICSIRDEFFERPTKPAHVWSKDENNNILLGGMDMQKGNEGGTWFAINMKTGNISSLLNIKQQKPLLGNINGRGFLVVDSLKQNKGINYLKSLKSNADQYNGFTLVTIDFNQKNYYLSSYSNLSNCLFINQFEQKSYIFTNSMRPDYPFNRGKKMKKKFDEILCDYQLLTKNSSFNVINQQNLEKEDQPINLTDIEKHEILTKKLLNVMLSNTEDSTEDDEYFKIQNCLVDENIKKELKKFCITIPLANYGSRTFTILLVDGNNKVNYYEWTRDNINEININNKLNKHFQFDLP